MANKVYSNLIDLHEEGYTATIAGCPDQGFYHNGQLLENATFRELLLLDELYGWYLFLYAVTSACGSIKGYTIMGA